MTPFTCGGSFVVADRAIKCANTNGHGLQKTLLRQYKTRVTPAFIQIGQKKTGKSF